MTTFALERPATREPFAHPTWILDAVERWAEPSQWLVRETVIAVDGRIDGVLIPTWFDAPVTRKQRGGWTMKLGLLGVEVKASRADFMRGLREGQFDRYDKSLAGLYVATTRAVKTAEIPAGVGHLVCFQTTNARTGWRCVCRRHVAVRDWEMDADSMWRLIFYAVKRARQAELESRQRTRDVIQRIGDLAGEHVVSALKKAVDRMNAEQSSGAASGGGGE